MRLMEFQRRFICAIYDNSAGTTRYLSIARKNGKSALIAAIALAHIVGPEAKLNSQIISGGRSHDEASIVYKLAEKMVRFNPDVRKIIKPIPSQKTLIGGAAARVLHVLCLSGWMAANVATRRTPAGNLKPAKDKSTERIDGIVATIMAVGRALVAQEEPQPEYSLHFV
jgi:phage terminase large subunit-like protein